MWILFFFSFFFVSLECFHNLQRHKCNCITGHQLWRTVPLSLHPAYQLYNFLNIRFFMLPVWRSVTNLCTGPRTKQLSNMHLVAELSKGEILRLSFWPFKLLKKLLDPSAEGVEMKAPHLLLLLLLLFLALWFVSFVSVRSSVFLESRMT